MQLINYASHRFEKAARLQVINFIHLGGRSFRSYRFLDLDSEFKSKNAETLARTRGAGYWVWKPEIILDALKHLDEGEKLLYMDAGVLLDTKPEDLDRFTSNNSISIWRSSSSHEPLGRWCHQNVIEELEIRDSELSSEMLMAGILIIPKNVRTLRALSEWSIMCSSPNLLLPDVEISTDSGRDYVWHRHDSTLLTLVCYRYSESFDVRSFDDFRNHFILHRNSKPFYLIFQPIRIIHLFRCWLISKLPTLIIKHIRLSKFQIVSKKKNLSAQEIAAHLKLWKGN